MPSSRTSGGASASAQTASAGDRIAHRTLPRRQVARPGREQWEAVLQPGEQRRRRQDGEARSRQLNSQGEAIELATDRGDGGGVRVGQHERRLGQARTLDEELHRRDVRQVSGCGWMVRHGRGGEREWWHAQLLLAV